MIRSDGTDTDLVDAAAAGFVGIKRALLARGRPTPAAPLDADRFEAMADRALADAMDRHGAR